MQKILLKNAEAIVSCDDEGRVYQHCDILIENNIITQIGSNISLNNSCDTTSKKIVDEVIDCKGKVIYPGLINTHHHFFSNFCTQSLIN